MNATQIWENTSTTTKILFFAMIIFIIYLGYATNKVPNTQYNLTYPNGATKIAEKIPINFTGTAVPFQLYGPQSEVPKDSVGGNRTVVFLILFFALIMAIFARGFRNRIDIYDAIKNEKKFLEYKRTGGGVIPPDPKLFKWKIGPNHHLQTQQFGTDERKPFKFHIQVTGWDERGHETHFVGAIHATTGDPDDLLELTMPLSQEECIYCTVCGHKGPFTDQRVLGAEEIMRAREIIGRR